MKSQLNIAVGQCSDKGRKPVNQDFHGVIAPEGALLDTKGVAVALADGISSSEVSQIASETAVKGFLADYYATPEPWTVKTSVNRVVQATNAWLHAQTRNSPHRYDLDRGYVCTFTALVFKSATAHLFHAGDARVYRRVDDRLEQLTEDHRHWISREKSYLSRALGMRACVEIDYQVIQLEVGDTFVLATDGIYEFVDEKFLIDALPAHADDLDGAARVILEQALHQGSDDNLTIQLLRVEQLPSGDFDELYQQASALPFPPELRPRMEFDGYRILRELHHSSRSHVYLAQDTRENRPVVLKTPSVDLRNDAGYLERFLMEDWVARRVDNANVIKPWVPKRKRNFLYIATEYVEGQTLTQWMIDNPQPGLETVRHIVEQIARGLLALHRQEMLHQDLRPHNVMIDKNRTVKLIDFGSVRVAGVAEIGHLSQHQHILGTAQYAAPEYFLGEPGTPRSDLFSLGVIAYQLLTGQLPYGTTVPRAITRAAQHRLIYRSALGGKQKLPTWVDSALRKAVQPNPNKRYGELSEFVHDLREPNPAFGRTAKPPLMERDPLLFWKGLSSLLLLIVLFLLGTHPSLHH